MVYLDCFTIVAYGHSAERKSKKCCLVSLISGALIILTVLVVVEVVFIVLISNVALKQRDPVIKVVAEGDTVSLAKIDQKTVNSVLISEIVLKGDSEHKVVLALVPTDKLTYDTAFEIDYWNGSAIVKDLPLINEMYVYLNKDSQIKYNIWFGTGSKANSAKLYVFDDEDKFSDYLSYQVVNSPVFSSAIPIRSDGIKVPAKEVIFTSPADGYYFIVMLSPEANIQFRYNVNATERVIDISKYTSDYPSCTVNANKNCTLMTSNDTRPHSQNWTLLAHAFENYDFGSKINHLQVAFTNRSYLMTVPFAILGSTVGVILVMLLVLSVVILYRIVTRSIKKRSGYTLIN